jgi:hypothetical protein
MGGNVVTHAASLVLYLSSSGRWVYELHAPPWTLWRRDKPPASAGNRSTMSRTSSPYPRHLPLLVSTQKSVWKGASSHCQAVVAMPRSTIDPYIVHPCLARLCDRENRCRNQAYSDVTWGEQYSANESQVFRAGVIKQCALIGAKKLTFSFFILQPNSSALYLDPLLQKRLEVIWPIKWDITIAALQRV